MKIPPNLEIVKACLDAHGSLSEAETIVLNTAIEYIRMAVNSEPEIVEPMYRHYKGGFYTRKRNARLSVDPRTMLKEGDTLVIYEDKKGRWHARELSEFKDPFVHSEKGVVPRFTCIREGNVEIREDVE